MSQNTKNDMPDVKSISEKLAIDCWHECTQDWYGPSYDPKIALGGMIEKVINETLATKTAIVEELRGERDDSYNKGKKDGLMKAQSIASETIQKWSDKNGQGEITNPLRGLQFYVVDAIVKLADEIKLPENPWTVEDPRMLREQIRVADVAYNYLKAERDTLLKHNTVLREALKPLAAIHDAYEDNSLDDEARKTWGLYDEFNNIQPHSKIELYAGRGGKKLLTLQDCDNAKQALITPTLSHLTVLSLEELKKWPCGCEYEYETVYDNPAGNKVVTHLKRHCFRCQRIAEMEKGMK